MQTLYQPSPQPLLFRLQGIPVRVHRWLLALVLFISVMSGRTPDGFSMAQVGSTVLALGILFLAVLLHEMGHAIVARRNGVEVVDITLWPLGGKAVLRRMPEDPQIEIRIAAAGPLVNLAIGGACLLLYIGMQGNLNWRSMLHTDVRNFGGILSFTAVCHLLIGAFNLIPAFPMDGGKIFRSLLAMKSEWLPATEVAVGVGRWLALGMLIASFVYGEWALAIIAVYLFFSGSKELILTRMRSMTRGANPLEDLFGGQFPNEEGAEPESPAPRSTSGFSEEDIQRMEQDKRRLDRIDGESDPEN